jgi:alkylation response protein AidB-like acyl-CoA dehydrogenase
MHQHAVLFHTWRYRRQQPGAGDLLRRIASDGVVLATAGGSDFTHPTGSATPVEGGCRVSGRKRFVSQSKAATVLSALFPIGSDDDRRIIGVTVPLGAPGVTVLDTWNTLGMRGTASNDVALDDVFVPEELLGPIRPYGVIDPPLQIIGTFAAPVISAVYLGVAESAYREAIERAAGSPDVLTQRAVGSMAVALRVAGWALDGALAVVGDDPEPSMETFAAVLAAKHQIARAGIDVCDIAMEVAGGGAFYKGSTIERAYRDIRAVKFHPLTPELTLLHAGRHALGLAADVL